ncbi:hypothetical protein [Dyadobacter bucti]|uniref:hypothetical protein n=1 Tax=Dyadobacter bucti TaxID=2572203 RepID=UPI00110A03FA|nr:hypothetical protein [Dyadobacter bucti]
MKVNIIRLKDNQRVESNIIKPNGLPLPNLGDGWRFNFEKHSKGTFNETFVLITDEMPQEIEGCLIFRLEKGEPYMAYIETAPHNKGASRRFDKVAGCLIAFACRLSFIHGEGHFKGWLAFDVLEMYKDDKVKLMSMYCQKYGALKWGETTMVISPEAGERLINQYLESE